MKRPNITLKLATSLDGKIALANGQSEWITGEKSREAGRRLRGEHDAIAIGSNTAVLDNPQLTTRISGAPNPIRVVFDTHLRLSPKSNLAQSTKLAPVWLFCQSKESERAEILCYLGVKLFPVAYDNGLDIQNALKILLQNNVHSLLIEGGGTLAASFIKLDVIDNIEWFRAPVILGGDGRNAIGDLGLESLNLVHKFNRVSVFEIGEDIYEKYERVK